MDVSRHSKKLNIRGVEFTLSLLTYESAALENIGKKLTSAHLVWSLI